VPLWSRASWILLGTSALSGLGSLPLHLLPFLVAVAIAAGVLSAAMAGWIGAAYMAGLLLTSLVLPLWRVEHLSRPQAAVAATLLVGALALGGEPAGKVLVLLDWFLVGVSCGVLQVMGAMAAARSEHRHDAFALRLAVTLAIAGAATAALQLMDAFASYQALAHGLALLTGAVAALALLLPMPPIEMKRPASARRIGPGVKWHGLVFIGLFFVGQHGLWAYTVEGAIGNGIDLSMTAVNISLCKFAACAALMTHNFGLSRRWPDRTLRAGGLALAISAGIVVATSDSALLLLGLLVWQVLLNTMSARFQAEVVAADPLNAGAWITAAIYVGSALGYVLRGAAIAIGVDWIFQAFIALSCFLPAMWMSGERSRRGHAEEADRRTLAEGR
jgi:hypothetical protein